MKTAKIIFHQLNQDSQEYGSNNEFMISRAFFIIKTNEKIYDNLYADIKQPVGSKFDDCKLEVYFKIKLAINLDYEIFRDTIENYYRYCLGSQGKGISFGPGTHIRMQDNLLGFTKEYEIKYSDKTGQAW